MKLSEILELPLETKVRLPWWLDGKYFYRERDKNGKIIWLDQQDRGHLELPDGSQYQDQWEIFEGEVFKKVALPKQYMTGLEAIKALYEGKKIAFDEPEWIRSYHMIYLLTGFPEPGTGSLMRTLAEALHQKFFNQAKWFVVQS